MHNIPLPIAEVVFSWSNIFLVVGTVLAFLGTVGVFWSTGIRERYAELRISTNEAETAKAKAEAAQANLQQEKLKAQMAWRRISIEQAKVIIAGFQGSGIEPWLSFVGNDPEATIFHEDINQTLTIAGITTKSYSGYSRAIGLGVRGGKAEERAAIVRAFTTAGVPIIETHEPGFFKEQLEILVGSKPPADFYR